MRKTFIILATLTLAQMVTAKPISSTQAIRNAQAFLQKKGISVAPNGMRRAPSANCTEELAPYYVFNLGDNEGFVIASGDDRAYPVLGYSDKGSMQLDNLPCNVQYWLDFYEAQVKALKDVEKTGAKPRKLPAKVVEPMLTTKWSQYNPFNLSCPTNQSGNRCITGCVATAMAQVMYYHRKYSTRKVMEEIPGYCINQSDTVTVESVPKGAVIDWDNMLDRYLYNSYTDEQAKAVANLMLYCGVSVNMVYGEDASGARNVDVAPALVKYFDYNEYLKFNGRSNYTDEEWESMIYEELAKGNPLIYCGSRSFYEGHCFVLDGCDADGYVHVNWGWGGQSDGYFLLTASGDRYALAGFSDSQFALFDAIPDGAIPRLTTNSMRLTGAATVEGLSTMTSFPVSFTMQVANLTDSQNSFEQAVGLCQNDRLISVVGTLPNIPDMAVNGRSTVNVSLSIDAKLPVGLFKLIPLSRKSGAANWHKNDNLGKFLTLTIDDDKAEIVVGIPPVEGNVIDFADNDTKRICINNWDKNGDGKLTKWEAAAVTDLGLAFKQNNPMDIDDGIAEPNYYNPQSFNELKYFTGLTTIGNRAFEYSSSLESITLPPYLQTIGDNAFFRCYNLLSINLPESLTEIGDGAFEDCSSLTSIVLPKKMTKIGESAFRYCESLTSIDIPEGVTLINPWTFDGSGLVTVSLPESLAKIDWYAFSCCKHLASIHLPSKITVIDSHAFEYCVKLENVYIPETVLSIGQLTFKNCVGLKSVSIPSQVKTIDYGAFYGCDALTTVVVKRPEPLSIKIKTFSNYADATLYVPKGSRNAYMEAENWKLFGKIVELSGVRGDVNNDSKTNVTDVTLLVNHILGMHSDGFIVGIADINGDGQVTVTDVTALVNIIIGLE